MSKSTNPQRRSNSVTPSLCDELWRSWALMNGVSVLAGPLRVRHEAGGCWRERQIGDMRHCLVSPSTVQESFCSITSVPLRKARKSH
ncbi:hypothetical protein FA13DRAFT_165874 [Coprinellus micaceus]|uniref:Uncharacterized protein n=1 Tax=Coprinellus micaceus TaxID=71717 RepID=A0A4Y7SHI1_COPMI|nr:hypothetical protein FA13DRAFT_165874 [Coprinellus micaceus]